MSDEVRATACLCAVRDKAPLVQCITNFVTVNDCANIILAIGGSPTMAHDIREAAEAVAACAALVLNLGAIDDAEAMLSAGARANALGIPVVLDPVAAGGTALRREIAAQLMASVRFAAIRGNASEIRALALGCVGGSGVDVSACDRVGEETLAQGLALAQTLARKTGAVVIISGGLDIAASADEAGVLRGGSPTMARITGSGCMLTALMGAFCGAVPQDPYGAAIAAAAAFNVCGELAEAKKIKNGTGTATFRTDLIDAVSLLTEEQLRGGIHYERNQGIHAALRRD